MYNSRKNTKSLKKGNTSQVFYFKRKKEVTYNKDKKRRYIGNPYPKIEERKKSKSTSLALTSTTKPSSPTTSIVKKSLGLRSQIGR